MSNASDTPRRLRVLLVDDHPGIVKSLSRLLAFDCEVVGSLPDCTRLLENVGVLAPDLVVLDVNFPRCDGLVACRELRQRHAEVKVIVFSAMDDPDLPQRALDAGASSFVHKLGADGELLAAVRRISATRTR
jgi:DNA-binding NarL/FixJ family response regulator